MGSKIIGFRIPDDLAEEIEAKAAEKGLSTSELLRDLVDRELYPSKGEKSDEVGVTTRRQDELTRQVEKLTRRVNEITEQMNELTDQVNEQTRQPNSNSALANKVNELEHRFNSLANNYEADQTFVANFIKEANPLKAKVLKLHLCPDCGAPLHIHHFEGKFHLECVECGFCSSDYEYPKWKEEREKLGVLEKREVEQEILEPPYLHIIDHPRECYFPWTEGRWAKIIEK